MAITDLLRGFAIAYRHLLQRRAFTATISLTLALGVGLSTAVFTVADALLLRPLPVRDQDRLVLLWTRDPSGDFEHYPLGLDDARELGRRTRALERVAFYSYYGASPKPVVDGDRITRLRRAQVSGDFFDVLGVEPELGRTLRPADNVTGAEPVVVLSHSAWQRRFGGDPRVLGKTLRMYDDGTAYTIVGVMPQGLEYPAGTDFWATVMATVPAKARGDIAVDVVGRLRPEATPADARAELTSFLQRPQASAAQRRRQGVVHSLAEIVLGDVRPALLVFAAASALLLLITCINVANLLLVRGLERAREVAVRSALGASRGRIVAHLLAENALLALAGGAIGVAVAAVAVRAFIALAPTGLPRADQIHLDGTALAGALAITAFAMLVFSLAPVLTTSRVEAQQVLRSGDRQSAGRRSRRLGQALVVGQVALAMLVLSAAGLIARSLMELQRADLSLEPSHLLIGDLSLQFDRYDGVEKQRALVESLLQRLRATPGVLGVSPVVAAPFSGSSGWDGKLAAAGQTEEEAAANPMLNMEVVSPDYIETLGTPLLRGRGFTAADREGAPAVVVVSESVARHFWPGSDPIGRRLTMGPGSEETFEVVGVVADTRYRDLRDARASVYFPLRQSFFPYAPLSLAIRTSGPPAALVPTIRRTIAETAPGVALADAAPFETLLEAPLAQPRLNALLLAIFAAAAVALAAVGLFGVMMTMVRQRARELGVRMALGATAADLRRLVVRHGLALAMIGLGFGLAAAFAATRTLESMLYDVDPTDAPTLAIVAVFLLIVTAIATAIPARSSTRVDPMSILRGDG